MIFYRLNTPVGIVTIITISSVVIAIWLLIVTIEVYGAADVAPEFFNRENARARSVHQDTSGYAMVAEAERRRQRERSDMPLYRDR